MQTLPTTTGAAADGTTGEVKMTVSSTSGLAAGDMMFVRVRKLSPVVDAVVDAHTLSTSPRGLASVRRSKNDD
jgi:hypothetical protein